MENLTSHAAEAVFPIWQMAYDALKEADIIVCPPGQRMGVCNTPYAVVREGETRPDPGGRTGRTRIDIQAFTPIDRYSALPFLVGRIQAALRPLGGMLRPEGSVAASSIDETYMAHGVTLGYSVLRRLSL